MTRDEAIKIFNTVLFFGKCDCQKEEIEEALTMAIDALEEKSNVDRIIDDVKELDGRHLIGDYENERWIELSIYPMN